MPLQSTSGAASYDGFGGGVPYTPTYIEDVFSTWLYTGNGSGQTINNGIDLQFKGGLVWTKSRSAATNHKLFDTNRGFISGLSSNSTAAATSTGGAITSWTSTGYTAFGTDLDTTSATYASWTFRKQPKFFDVVTYTGTGSSQTISHNLGSVPGCIIIKRTDSTSNWFTYHRGNGVSGSSGFRTGFQINSDVSSGLGLTQPPATSTTFSAHAILDSSLTSPTINGATYVAYLFAHDAGGFGLTGTDNVISCGSYTGNGSNTGPVINLGYEPQFVMIKNATGTGGWNIVDTMRGMPAQYTSQYLRANAADAEATSYYAYTNATGFQIGLNNSEVNTNASTYIYIAIRRGPMKVPTSGTSVFLPYSSSSTSVNSIISTGFPVDLMFSGQKNSNNSGDNWSFVDRLRGPLVGTSTASGMLKLLTTSTAAEASLTYPNAYNWWNTGVVQGIGLNGASVSYQFFRRAPGFFDEVCYTGTGVARTVTHNLAAVPELMIVKCRSLAGSNWDVYSQPTGAGNVLVLNGTNGAILNTTYWNSASPTSTVFTVGTASDVNGAGATFVAYLFASCPGVSKVGSFTGTSLTQVINCGFTAGARFVLIKTTSGTGNWYVWDSARGIVAGNDPYLLLNDISAEVTTTDWVDTAATGFELTGGANPANIAGATYIFLAIA